ncbi:SpoIID/LytB domain-containing protein [Nocardioides pacificus]
MRPPFRLVHALAVTSLTLVLTGLSPLVPTAGAAPADDVDAKRVSQRWTVPTSATITIRGRGYGHGHGMSQYGAEGAARAGLDHREIIAHYYPGAQWARAAGTVSVMISDDTSDDVVVAARSNLTVRDLAAEKTWTLPANGAKRWRLTTDRAGRTVVSYRAGGWKRWRVLRGDGEFYAKGGAISLVTPAGVQRFRGRLRAASPTPGARAKDTVNVLALDNYLKGVVPLEMPASWSPAAVRAQAVAARTYATYERSHPRAGHYQICDTTSCQVYGGYDVEHPLSNAAIVATRRQALTYQGKPAFTQFGSSSGGWTSAGSVPYMPAREDRYDGWAGNPVHQWTTSVSDAAIEARWPAVGDLQAITVTERDGNGEWGGRVWQLRLSGSKGVVRVSGDTFRSVLGLRSTWLDFAVRKR